MNKTRILILGGGFAGVGAARYLDRTVAKRSDVEVTLIEPDIAQYVTPRDVESINRLLETARQSHGEPTPEHGMKAA